jgi:exodeoxyribonuclease V beta subunit
MDRLKKAPPNRDAIIYEYDGISLQNIYLRIKGRDAIDEQYANALAKDKALVYEDSLNALYVAFTRAKENLFIIKKSKDSMFDILDLDAKEYGSLHVKASLHVEDKVEFKEFNYQELYYGTQSDILKLESQDDEDLKAINFGLAMHYALEMMSEFSPLHVEQSLNMMINKYGNILQDSEVDDIKNRIEMLLAKQEFQNIAKGECFREKALRYKNNLRYIDLLVKKDDGSWIVVDYKSSYAYVEHHHKQVNYYVKAIKEITGDEVEGYICYLLENEVRFVKT